MKLAPAGVNIMCCRLDQVTKNDWVSRLKGREACDKESVKTTGVPNKTLKLSLLLPLYHVSSQPDWHWAMPLSKSRIINDNNLVLNSNISREYILYLWINVRLWHNILLVFLDKNILTELLHRSLIFVKLLSNQKSCGVTNKDTCKRNNLQTLMTLCQGKYISQNTRSFEFG